MKKTLAAIVVASALTFGTIGIGHSNSLIDAKQYTECIEKYEKFTPGKDYVKGEILVGFDEGTTEQEAKQFLEDRNFEMIAYHPSIHFAEVKVPEGKEIHYICEFKGIADETIVNYAEPNHIMRILPTNTPITPIPLINI